LISTTARVVAFFNRVRVALLLSLLSLPAFAGREKLAVLDPGGDPKLSRALLEQLLLELNHSTRFEAIGSSDLAVMLGVERQRQLLQCDDTSGSCTAEILGALGAPWVLSSSVVRVGSKVRLDLKLLSANDGGVRARTGSVISSDEDLFTAVTASVKELFRQLEGGPPPSKPWWPWVVGGAGVVAAGAGAVLMISASSGVSGLEQQKPTTAWATLQRSLSGLQTQYWVGFGCAVAGGLAVVTWAAVLLNIGEPLVQVGAYPAPGGGGLYVGGRF